MKGCACGEGVDLITINAVRACDWRARRCVVIVAVATALRAAVYASAAEMPAELVERLEANVAALTPITVSWTEQLGSDVSLQEWLKKVNSEPFYVDEFNPMDVIYAWQDRMSYSQVKQEKAEITTVIVVDQDGKVRPRPGADFDNLPHSLEDREVACNLNEVFLGQDREASSVACKTPSLVIDSIDQPRFFKADAVLFDPTYFYEAGYVLPTKLSMQGNQAKSLPLALLREGARVKKIEQTVLDGERCLLLELGGEKLITRFFLDMSRGYAVLRREEETPSGQRTTTSELSAFLKFQNPDIWLPQRCTVAYHTSWTIPGVVTPKPHARRTFVVRRIDRAAIPLARFSLKYTMPRTAVTDSTLPQAKGTRDGLVRYLVPANLEDLDAAIKAAGDGGPFRPAAPVQRRRHPMTLFFWLIPLVVCVAILVARRFRSRISNTQL